MTDTRIPDARESVPVPGSSVPGNFFVCVDTRGAPHLHATLQSALTEAKRLADQPMNAGHAVRVFSLVATIAPAKRPEPMFEPDWKP